ncbi:MAG: TlpA disulfide reductase family protein [Candidatus Omnitrophica bacterium]|nr:TlpA disulfide reductase family protein [Candidatus Omnitrophota bacterium]
MKISLISLLAIFIFLSLSCAKKTTVEEQPPIQMQEPAAVVETKAKRFGLAQDFILKDLNQNTVILSSYKNKQPVLLFFWTTWCPYCRGELKVLNGIYPELTKEGWEVFAIDVDEPAYRVESFLESYGLIFKVLLDKDAAVMESYGLFGVPTYVLVDKEGYIVFKDHYFPKGEYKKLILG